MINLLPLTLWLCAALAPMDPHDRAVHQGIAWLEEAITCEEWQNTNATLGNIGSKKKVVEAITAYLLLLYPERREYRTLLDSLDRKILNRLRGRGSDLAFGSFANWEQGISSLYLLEKACQGEVDQGALRALAAGMESRQNAEGGWGHGLSLGIDFYPTTLVAATSWALFTLGGCRRFGVEVDEEALEDALSLLSQVQAPSGGFPYGGPGYRKGIEAGRTGAVVLALAALDQGDGELFEKGEAYISRNLASIPDGHASPALHVLTGAMVAQVLGEVCRSRYDRLVLSKVLDHQDRSGSFRDVVEGSPDSLSLLGDDLTNTAYRTALYAAALASPRSKCLASLRIKERPASKEQAHPGHHAPKPALNGSIKLEGVSRLALWKGRCGALTRDGILHCFQQEDGRILTRHVFDEADQERNAPHMVRFKDQVLVWFQAGGSEKLPQSLAALVKSRSVPGAKPALRMTCLGLGDGKPRWQTDLKGPIARIRACEEGIYLLTDQGSLSAHAPDTGLILRTYPSQPLRVNHALAPLRGGALAMSNEANLRVLEPSGEQRWRYRNRSRPKGVTPPAIGVLITADSMLYTGATDGSVVCRDALTGHRKWTVMLKSAVRHLVSTKKDCLAILTWDGLLYGVAQGEIEWIFDLNGGRESTAPTQLGFDQKWILAASPAQESLFALDPDCGEAVARIPFTREGTWDSYKGSVVVADEGRIYCYEVKRDT